MKTAIAIIAATALLGACRNAPKEEPKKDTVVVVKTTVREREVPVRRSVEPAYDAAEASAPATTQKKKGWSDAAKGTAIGGVAGGVAGALIDGKDGNRTEGILIGTALGAGTGYVIGRANDRKTGRVKPKPNN